MYPKQRAGLEKLSLSVCMCVCVCMLVAQLCPDLCNLVDCGLPASFVHGILQARIMEWGAILFSRGSSQPRDQTLVFLHCRQILHHLSQQGSPGFV